MSRGFEEKGVKDLIRRIYQNADNLRNLVACLDILANSIIFLFWEDFGVGGMLRIAVNRMVSS